MKYLFNDKEITREEMVGIIEDVEIKEAIANNLYKIGCYAYVIWDNDNKYSFIPD